MKPRPDNQYPPDPSDMWVGIALFAIVIILTILSIAYDRGML